MKENKHIIYYARKKTFADIDNVAPLTEKMLQLTIDHL